MQKLQLQNIQNELLDSIPVGKIAEKAWSRSVFLTIRHFFLALKTY